MTTDDIDLKISEFDNNKTRPAAANSGTSGPGCGGPDSSSDVAANSSCGGPGCGGPSCNSDGN